MKKNGQFLIFFLLYAINVVISTNITFSKNKSSTNLLNKQKTSFLKVDEKTLTDKEFDELSMFGDMDSLEIDKKDNKNETKANKYQIPPPPSSLDADDDFTDLLNSNAPLQNFKEPQKPKPLENNKQQKLSNPIKNEITKKTNDKSDTKSINSNIKNVAPPKKIESNSNFDFDNDDDDFEMINKVENAKKSNVNSPKIPINKNKEVKIQNIQNLIKPKQTIMPHAPAPPLKKIISSLSPNKEKSEIIKSKDKIDKNIKLNQVNKNKNETSDKNDEMNYLLKNIPKTQPQTEKKTELNSLINKSESFTDQFGLGGNPMISNSKYSVNSDKINSNFQPQSTNSINQSIKLNNSSNNSNTIKNEINKKIKENESNKKTLINNLDNYRFKNSNQELNRNNENQQQNYLSPKGQSNLSNNLNISQENFLNNPISLSFKEENKPNINTFKPKNEEVQRNFSNNSILNYRQENTERNKEEVIPTTQIYDNLSNSLNNIQEFDVTKIENLEKLTSEIAMKIRNKSIDNENLMVTSKKLGENFDSLNNQNLINQAKVEAAKNELNLVNQIKTSYLTQTDKLKQGTTLLTSVNEKYKNLSDELKTSIKKISAYDLKIQDDISLQDKEKKLLDESFKNLHSKYEEIRSAYLESERNKNDYLDKIKKNYEDLDTEQIKLLKLNKKDSELQLEIKTEENKDKLTAFELEKIKSENIEEIKNIEDLRLQLEKIKSVNGLLKKDISDLEEKLKTIDQDNSSRNLEYEIKQKELEEHLNQSKNSMSNEKDTLSSLKEKYGKVESDLKNKISYVSLQSNNLLGSSPELKRKYNRSEFRFKSNDEGHAENSDQDNSKKEVGDLENNSLKDEEISALLKNLGEEESSNKLIKNSEIKGNKDKFLSKQEIVSSNSSDKEENSEEQGLKDQILSLLNKLN